ncbi:MAG TPA: DUF3568 family protein, partial [Phycisphaerales bacterium]|nr:DUF3568 family protein [Phycisphaerales bacterium]
MIALGDHGPWYAVAAKSQATPQYTPANALSFYRREPASDALMNKPESKILYYAGPQEPTRTAAAMKPDPLSNLAPIVIGAVLIGLLASCAPPFLFANAGVSLAEAGTSAFVEGELRAAKKIPLDVADRAFTQALSNLRFEIERRVEGDGFVYITADQVGDDDIQVRLTSRSPA